MALVYKIGQCKLKESVCTARHTPVLQGSVTDLEIFDCMMGKHQLRPSVLLKREATFVTSCLPCGWETSAKRAYS